MFGVSVLFAIDTSPRGANVTCSHCLTIWTGESGANGSGVVTKAEPFQLTAYSPVVVVHGPAQRVCRSELMLPHGYSCVIRIWSAYGAKSAAGMRMTFPS